MKKLMILQIDLREVLNFIMMMNIINGKMFGI